MRLPKLKTIESRVWELCKIITRKRYEHVCISCGEPKEGKDLHTGHFFRKKFIPIQMKYDLRLLRPQCSYCNLRLHGNLEWYSVNLIKQEGADYLLSIAEDVDFYKEQKLDTKQTRAFLLSLESRYAKLV